MAVANLSGRRIRERRNEAGMSQVELAAALEVEHSLLLDRSDISEIERGVRGLKDHELNAIATILEVSPTWLLRGNEDDVS